MHVFPRKGRGEIKKEERTIFSVKKEQEDLWTLALASQFGTSKDCKRQPEIMRSCGLGE
jgi:hypothetical protein